MSEAQTIRAALNFAEECAASGGPSRKVWELHARELRQRLRKIERREAND